MGGQILEGRQELLLLVILAAVQGNGLSIGVHSCLRLAELPLQLPLLLLQLGKIGLDAGNDLHGHQHVPEGDGDEDGAETCDALTLEIKEHDRVEQVLKSRVDDITGGDGQLTSEVGRIIRDAVMRHGVFQSVVVHVTEVALVEPMHQLLMPMPRQVGDNIRQDLIEARQRELHRNVPGEHTVELLPVAQKDGLKEQTLVGSLA
mmetsp:Transcript_26940/g.69702  ORF Transcript_26940/g.69702 Transcript_26940/m.69702 type:complete len:204 (-) Transcript_26940:313-924(-)